VKEYSVALLHVGRKSRGAIEDHPAAAKASRIARPDRMDGLPDGRAKVDFPAAMP
jgi:hypothetical protein